ncbi:MAG: hypothetical protein PHN49_08290, partial [Candidatus Omnitrophica bacterium]|nr:hypothetical protein [Candidatus Omnitrophota bacterium]
MTFLDTIHSYENKIEKLKISITQEPNNWLAYQEEVDGIIDSVFNLCWEYERQHADDEVKLYKMKRLFNENFMHYFKLGRLGRMVIEKPFGYHGDFLIIDEIYSNKAETLGLERCMDNYFLRTAASIATRNRKEDFKAYLLEIVNKTKSEVRIMDLASGPCRDIKEFLDKCERGFMPVIIDCVDHDIHAINYGKNVLNGINQ